MGMYDEVGFTCPQCGTYITDQTKYGPCSLNTYPANRVPASIEEGYQQMNIWCSPCRQSFRVVSYPLIENYKLTLVPWKPGMESE